MKKLLIGFALFLSTASQIHTMENPAQTQRHQCSKTCIKGCPIVKGHQSNMIADLKDKLLWGNSRGILCNHIETEGIETLFVEKEVSLSVSQKKVFKICAANALVTTQTQEKEESTSDASAANALNKKKLSFLECVKGLTILILSGSSEVKKLLKPESEEAASNNLDAAVRSLQIKNNDFTELLKTASTSEKEDNDFIRLDESVSDLIETGRVRAQKEPFATFLEDISHPYSGYMSEVRLLHRRLHPPAFPKN